MKYIYIFLVAAMATQPLLSQENSPCSDLKKGTFRYLDIEDTTAYFVLDKEEHIEYHNGGKYTIQSRVKWLKDCQYEMLMVANTIPGFPFKPGSIMVVTINRVENDIVYYTSEVNGIKWEGRLRKTR